MLRSNAVPRLLLALFAASGLAGAPPAAPDVASPPPSARYLDLEETRSTLPAPLRYGEWSPSLGAWVDYQLTGKGGRNRVRLAHVALTSIDDSPAHQLEFDFPDARPPVLVTFWLSPPPDPVVGRFAAWVRPHTPVSVPLDVLPAMLEIRGRQISSAEVKLEGAFAGPARLVVFQDEEGRKAEVVFSAQVPVLGVYSVAVDGEKWTATASGTGAKVGLSVVPIVIPRLPASTGR